MEASELLQNFRLIVRDEMTLFMERMEAHFDHVNTQFDDLYARLDRFDHRAQTESCTDEGTNRSA
jgi:hypothetical protein